LLPAEQLTLPFWDAVPRHPSIVWSSCLPEGRLDIGLTTRSQCKEANQGPVTLLGEGRNVSLLPPSLAETRAVYICMFVRCNAMEGTLRHFGSSIRQELEAKKDEKNKIKRKRSHAGWTAMFPYLFCLQCFVNRFQ